jgi:hypothetical protein
MARRFRSLEQPFSVDPGNTAIEKIDNRIKKDVRTATFGILQYMDDTYDEIGALRRKAMNENRRAIYEAKKLFSKGESDIYPQIPALDQRDVRQMRKQKPGVVPRPERWA